MKTELDKNYLTIKILKQNYWHMGFGNADQGTKKVEERRLTSAQTGVLQESLFIFIATNNIPLKL